MNDNEPKPEPEQEQIRFSSAEALVFREALAQAQAKMEALNTLVRLAVAQRDLAGAWQLTQDASGLVKQG